MTPQGSGSEDAPGRAGASADPARKSAFRTARRLTWIGAAVVLVSLLALVVAQLSLGGRNGDDTTVRAGIAPDYVGLASSQAAAANEEFQNWSAGVVVDTTDLQDNLASAAENVMQAQQGHPNSPESIFDAGQKLAAANVDLTTSIARPESRQVLNASIQSDLDTAINDLKAEITASNKLDVRAAVAPDPAPWFVTLAVPLAGATAGVITAIAGLIAALAAWSKSRRGIA